MMSVFPWKWHTPTGFQGLLPYPWHLPIWRALAKSTPAKMTTSCLSCLFVESNESKNQPTNLAAFAFVSACYCTDYTLNVSSLHLRCSRTRNNISFFHLVSSLFASSTRSRGTFGHRFQIGNSLSQKIYKYRTITTSHFDGKIPSIPSKPKQFSTWSSNISKSSMWIWWCSVSSEHVSLQKHPYICKLLSHCCNNLQSNFKTQAASA